MTLKRTLVARRLAAIALLLLALTLLVQSDHPAVHADSGGKVYWTDGSGSIGRANADGSDVEELVTGLDTPYGIALDVAGGKMYWTEVGGPSGKISRANLDGTDVEVLVASDCCSFRSYIALDVVGGKMYWTSLGEGSVKRANLDGSAVETIATGQNYPTGIAVDPAAGRVYWTVVFGGIKSAALDGTDVQMITNAPQIPTGLFLDASAGVFYATGLVEMGTPGSIPYFDSEMLAMPVAGSPVWLLRYLTNEGLVDAVSFQAVTVDPGSEEIFWTEPESGVIFRWNRVSEPVPMVTGLNSPNGIALDITELEPLPTPTPPPSVGGVALDGGIVGPAFDTGGQTGPVLLFLAAALVLATLATVRRLRLTQ